MLNFIYRSIIVIVLAVILNSSNHGSLKAQNSRGDEQQKFSSNNKSEFITSRVSELKIKCTGKKNELITIQSFEILCFHGEIEPTPIEKNRKYDFAYFNSPGGDVLEAMAIGRELFRNGAYVIVDQHCHSACGSYIVPSAKRIVMTDDTVISIHTATPRTAKDFILTRYPKGVRGVGQGEIIKLFDQFDNFHRDFVIAEMDFFKSIARDVAYAQRYREIYRTLARRENYACRPEAGLYLIVGPQYLEEFGIKTIRQWFPKEKGIYSELIPASSQNNVLIFDFDDHPFWVPAKGQVKPEDCLKDPGL